MYQDESCDHCYEYRQNGALERIHVFNLPEVATMGTAILMTLEIDDFDVSYSQGGWRGEVWIRRSGVRRQRGGCIELNPVHGIEAVAGASKENQGFDSLEAFCLLRRPTSGEALLVARMTVCGQTSACGKLCAEVNQGFSFRFSQGRAEVCFVRRGD
jgi:hypothetical protein